MELMTGCSGDPAAPGDRLAGKATVTVGLQLGRSEMLRSLKRYSILAQSQVRLAIDCTEKRARRTRGKLPTIFLERSGKSHLTGSVRFKGNAAEKIKTWNGAHTGCPKRQDTI